MSDFLISQLPEVTSASTGDFVIINTRNVKTNRIDVKDLVETFGDAKYLRTDAAAGNQTVASTGTTTFNGLNTFNKGIAILGDDSRIRVFSKITSDSTSSIFTCFPPTVRPVGNTNPINELACFVAGWNGTDSNVGVTNLHGFKSAFTLGDNQSGTNFGFYSELYIPEATSTAINYNFYAAGTSPNFFQGDTLIGGSTARNTRQLWESTLTDEQKEQLAAGTLVVPANVSLPGDGSFARQWWYDQQDEETQTLLDAGELEYPEQLAAATFTDTFALGDNTNINLKRSGASTFRGGILAESNITIDGNGSFQAGGDSIQSNLFFISSTTNVGTPCLSYTGSITYNRDAGTVHGILSNPKINITGGGNYVGYFTDLQNGSQNVGGTNIGYLSGNNIQAASTVGGTGFKSNLNVANGKTNFNFYAGGTAPNYFRGAVACSGVTDATIPDVNTQEQEGSYLTPLGSIVSTANGGEDALANLFLQTTSTNPTRTLAIFYNKAPNAGGSIVGRITHDGANTSYVEDSDYRLKKNITPLSSSVERIKALNPVTFNYTTKNPDKTYEGFVAHELQEQVANAVTGTKDATEEIGTLADFDGTVLQTQVTEPAELEYTEEVETDGVATMVTRTRTWTPTGTRPVYQGVDQTKLIPLLTKALQECLERIETLEALIN